MSHYLVTGGAGFIGSHLVEALVARGDRVRILDNLSTGRRDNLEAVRARVELIEGDAADPGLATRTVAGVDGVFHLAAIPSVPFSTREPLANQRAGEVAALAIFAAAQAAGVRRVVFSSSSAVYGDAAPQPAREDSPTQPRSCYAQSKLAGEGYARILCELHPGFDAVSLRYFNVFGPRQIPSSPYSGVISIFLDCLNRGAAPTIYGDGQQERDFVEVSNVVTANLLAMDAAGPFRGECFNVGTGSSVTVLALWQFIGRLGGNWLEPVFAQERPGEIRRSCADINRVSVSLGYREHVAWKDGVKRLWVSSNACVPLGRSGQ